MARSDEPLTGILHTLEGHTAEVKTATIDADGQIVASASHDGTVRLWNAATGQLNHILLETVDTMALALTPNGRTLVCGSYYGFVYGVENSAWIPIRIISLNSHNHQYLTNHTTP